MASKIHRVELYNFKSYGGHVVVGPFMEFTCIVGPNGAGKSNLMDALSFVLSTTSTSTMRGKRLTDFIHRNASKKECAVSIVLRHAPSSVDDSTSAPPDGASARAVETKFTRRVDAYGASAVLVDGQVVSEREFRAALSRHRIGARVNTFLVFQHEVEAVAQKKATELTELLEQLSGSGELKQEYNAKKAALASANEALASASLEKRTATVAANQLRLAKKEATKFEETRRRLAEEKRDLALAELFSVETELQNQKDELQRFHDKLRELARGIPSEQAIREMKRNYATHHKAYLTELKENRQSAEELRVKRGTMERITAALRHLKRQQEGIQKELAAAEQVDHIRSRELQRLQDQHQRHVTQLTMFDEQCAKEDAESAAVRGAVAGEHMAEYRQLRKEADCETVTLRQQQETVQRERVSAEEAVKQSQLIRGNFVMQRDEVAQSMQRTAQRDQELEQRHKDLQEAVEALQKDIASARREYALSQKQSAAREAELAKVQEQLHELRYMKDTDKHNSRMADALQALRSLFNVRGRLVDLCTIPSDRYRNAVTIALGRHLEAVVVDTADVAIACVRYLKEQRMAPMTFLPLDSLQSPVVDDRLRTLGGTCKPLLDVVRCDAEVEPAVRFALGQTLVCDSMEEARRIAYGRPDGERLKVVTVDGTMLLRNGSVQGGLAAVQSRARKWDEKKYEDLRAARDRLLNDVATVGEAALARMQIAIRDREARLEFTRSRMAVVEVELSANREKLRNLQAEERKLEESVAAAAARVEHYQNDCNRIHEELLHIAKAIAATEGRIFAEFQKKVNVPHLLQLEGQQAQQAQQRAEHRQQLRLLIHKLETSIEMEEKRLGSDAVVALRDANARIEKELTQRRNDLAAYQTIIAKAEQQNAAIQAKVTAARASLNQLEADIRRVSRTSEQEMVRLSFARKGATGLQAACDALRLRRQNILRRCQMEEVDLPLVPAASPGEKRQRDGGETTREAVHVVQLSEPVALLSESPASPGSQNNTTTTTSTPSSPTATSGSTDKDAKMCIDFRALPTHLRELAEDRARLAAYRKRTESLVDSLVAELDALGPNLRSVTRSVAMESRLESSTAALEEVRERARQAHGEFLEVKERRTARFMEVYERIAASVDRVYQELTLGTRAHAVHGSAYLSLEDVEEPYLGGTTYHATPPLKRFMPMELLSGGERTMAALALLFAVHMVSPTPFFVLDEVDAALDAGNVEKLAHYLRKNCTNCQFIVVSLKDQLYHMADLLVGVLKRKEKASSDVLTMDLRGFPY